MEKTETIEKFDISIDQINSDDKLFLFKDDSFIISFLEEEDHYSFFQIFEIQGETCDDKGDDVFEVDLYLEGMIKWDGCSHFYFGKEEGYIHLCGKSHFEKHKKILDTIWDMCSKRIKNFDNEVAG